MCYNIDVPPSALFLFLQVTAGGEEPEEGEVPNYVSNKGKGPARWAWLRPCRSSAADLPWFSPNPELYHSLSVSSFRRLGTVQQLPPC